MANIHILVLTIIATYSFTTILSQTPKLIYVQEVFRHGARYPIYPSANDNSIYAQNQKAAGQLTYQGKSMHYILGQNLYGNYWTKLFNNTKSYNQTKFYIKSTNVNRTIESVQSQLLGIFQNLNQLKITNDQVKYSLPQWPGANRNQGDVYVNSPRFNPLPVHVEKGYMSTTDSGDFLRTYSSQICYKQADWMQSNKYDPNIKEIISHPNFTKVITALGTQLQQNIAFWDVYKYYDNAQCMTYQGKKNMLPIFSSTGDDKKALDAIYSLDLYIKMFYTEQQLSVTATGFFNETVNHFKRVTANQDGVQWSFYSAHDTTIANFIARLNLTSVNCIYQNFLAGNNKNTNDCIVQYPIYTSNLIFQIYQYPNSTNTFKIRYNGQYRRIPFCDNALECNVEQFYIWYNGWKDQKYVAHCGIKNKTQETYFTILVLQFGVIVVFAIAAVLAYLNKKHDAADAITKAASAPVITEGNKEQRNVLQESLLSYE